MASIESNHRLINYRWGDCERVGKFYAALNQLTLAQQVGILLRGLVKMLLFNWVSLSFIAWASNSNEIVESLISISPHCDNASWLVFRPDFQRYWVFFAIYEFLIMFLVTEIFVFRCSLSHSWIEFVFLCWKLLHISLSLSFLSTGAGRAPEFR